MFLRVLYPCKYTMTQCLCKNVMQPKVISAIIPETANANKT